jgi:hypothetical protein
MSEPLHAFDGVPPLGTELTLDGQFYVLVEHEPYRRQTDGEMTTLLIWHTECAECLAPFRCQSTVRVGSLNRRCQTHKRPGHRVGGKRRHQPIEVRVRFP